MSDFFLELFSEEIPANLQKNARDLISENFKKLFEEKQILFKESKSYSTPNRLIILFEGLPKDIKQNAEEIRGPSISSPEKALEGFLRSNQISKNEIYKKNTEKGDFYFFKKAEKKIKTIHLLEQHIPKILDKTYWKKSMKWGNFDLSWARPLKSILGVFDNKSLIFKFHHLECSNTTFVDKEFEDKKKIFKNFKYYKDYFKKSGIMIDNILRRKFIEKELLKSAKKKNIEIDIDSKLLDEVTELVEQPNILICKFEEKFLQIPKEILIITMRHHQKYFYTMDQKGNITNNFLVVANNKDLKGFIKSGNERVIEARLSDAKFFWEKNKSQNLVKLVGSLKTINFFSKLGSVFEKIQRIRKLGSHISDELNFNKEKIEIASSICKVDLLSDLVGEYPELQGVMGSYFAKEQGFNDDVCLAIREQYLPIGLIGKVQKKPISIVVGIVDKLDTLVGFFGINEKPTSSKDPFALRRAAFGLIRIIIENNLKVTLKDLINYSIKTYQEQGFELTNDNVCTDLINYLKERIKNYFKEKKIRIDIIEAAVSSYNSDDFVSLYKKCKILNKSIDNDIGKNILSSYKRASSILDQEIKKNKLDIKGMPDVVLFKKKEEKILFDEINEIRKYLSSNFKNENFEKTLQTFADSKNNTDIFFENVVVNDENESIKINRLELLKMFCMTLDNFINFSKIDGA